MGKTTDIINSPDYTKWLVLLSVGLGTFMSALDASVVNVSLPVITHDFQSSITQIEWVVTIYLLTVSCLLLAFGRLGDMQGHKRVYTFGFVIFILSSALCGLSTSAGMLIGLRALQAIGAAMLFANSPAILTGNFPAAQRGQALGLQATLTYLGLAVGPSLGGFLTQHFGWQAVFYINVPIGLLALFFCLRFIPNDRRQANGERFDWIGAGLFLLGMVSLLFVLNQGQSWGWGSLPTLALAVFALLCLLLFVRLEIRSTNPMLDLNLFRQRVFSFSVLSALLNYMSMYCIIFLLPFYLIQARGFSPAHSGLILTVQAVVMSLTAPISGYFSDRVSPRWLATIGMAILAAGLGMLSFLQAATPQWYIAISLAVTGLGTGMFISPNNNVLLGSAPRNRQGIASGILATARNVGMVLGVGLAGAVFTTVLGHGELAIDTGGIFRAIQSSFVVGAGIAVVGIFTSFLRSGSE
ncbi:MAG: MFS transporter [Chloroflexi bacterium HGW-Chloroflexi-10]|nr:MAG: MFS transporter [Chloroflexi bacterium HGW-Chloroflexi-10]